MSEFANRAAGAREQAASYTASLLAMLGDRDPLEVLRGTPAALRAAVRTTPRHRLGVPEAPGKWSIAQVIFHLEDSEIVGAYRYRMPLAQDRPPLAGYDQDSWMERLHGRGDATAVDHALDMIETLRRANIRLLEGLSTAELARVGVHAERGDESVAHMMRLYAGHDLVHLGQIARIRAAVA